MDSIDDLYRVEILYPESWVTLTPHDKDQKLTLKPNEFSFEEVFDKAASHGPIFSMSIEKAAGKEAESGEFIKVQPRVERLFDVGPKFQLTPIFPAQLRKLKTFNEKYVLGMGDFNDTGVPHGSLLFAERNTFEAATTSPDFKYSVCYDFSIVPKVSDKDYILINLCDTENTTSKLTIFDSDDVSLTIPTPGSYNDIRLHDYYDKIETLPIDASTVMVFLRQQSTKKLESFIITIGKINLTTFYHFAIEKIPLEWKNVLSFSATAFATYPTQKTAIVNVLQEENPEFTTYSEVVLSADPSKVKVLNSGTLWDSYIIPVDKKDDSPKAFNIGSQYCYSYKNSSQGKVGCVMRMSKGHLKEFTIIQGASETSGPEIQKTIPRIRVYGVMTPIDGTIKANERYVTYLARSMHLKNEKTDPVTGELLDDLTLMVYDKQCLETCVSVTNFENSQTGQNDIPYLELFQAVDGVITNAKLNNYNLPGYELDGQFILVATNTEKALAHTYKINDNFSFIVYKDKLDTDLKNLVVDVNFQREHGDPENVVTMDQIFKMGEESSNTIYWVFGSIILAVAIIVAVVFIVICIKKRKSNPGFKLNVNRDDMERILEE